MSTPPAAPAPVGSQPRPLGERSRRRRSLSTRLVIIVVCLLGALAVAIGAAAAWGLRSYLTGEVDQQLTRMTQGGGPGGGVRFNGGPDSLVVAWNDTQAGGYVAGFGRESDTPLSSEAVARVRAEATTTPQTVQVPGVGSYRVALVGRPPGAVSQGSTVALGLPMGDVEDAVLTLLAWEAVLTVTGLLVAGLAGRALVRRQLAPLREVAATAHRVAQTPMASGAVQPVERVPGALLDSGREVGQVGAALNTLLDHVESSLTARHESELQVRQFVADASHELRTPLATVRGYSELARRNPADAHQTRVSLEKVEQESARMSALVEDLLLLARLDQGHGLSREPVDLRALAVESLVDAQVLAPEHHWQLDLGETVHAEQGDPEHAPPDEANNTEFGVVHGDPVRLHQVVSNLVTNAWRHTPPGTSVTVALRPLPNLDGVRLVISDDGPGIDADLVPRVFERFTRADKARTRGRGTASHGTGLGLSTVRAIVLAHGGEVSVTSSTQPERHGTRFVVDLPAAGAAPELPGEAH